MPYRFGTIVPAAVTPLNGSASPDVSAAIERCCTELSAHAPIVMTATPARPAAVKRLMFVMARMIHCGSRRVFRRTDGIYPPRTGKDDAGRAGGRTAAARRGRLGLA